jgi:formylglycine-generating enzyme required for sulfatase activity
MVCAIGGSRPSYFTGCLPEDRQCFGLERHPAKIAVSGFWMGHTEVTQSAWRA